MKIVSLAVALMLWGVSLSAQVGDAYLSKVEAAASANTTYGSEFKEVRKAKNAKEKVCRGSFSYDCKGTIIMTYTDPAGELFKVADGKLEMVRDGKEHDLDAKKNPMARKMSQSLVCLFAGKVKEAAEVQNADYKVEEKDDTYVVTLTARKRAVKGFGKTCVTYSKSTGHVVAMYLEEFNGNSSNYTL